MSNRRIYRYFYIGFSEPYLSYILVEKKFRTDEINRSSISRGDLKETREWEIKKQEKEKRRRGDELLQDEKEEVNSPVEHEKTTFNLNDIAGENNPEWFKFIQLIRLPDSFKIIYGPHNHYLEKKLGFGLYETKYYFIDNKSDQKTQELRHMIKEDLKSEVQMRGDGKTPPTKGELEYFCNLSLKRLNFAYQHRAYFYGQKYEGVFNQDRYCFHIALNCINIASVKKKNSKITYSEITRKFEETHILCNGIFKWPHYIELAVKNRLLIIDEIKYKDINPKEIDFKKIKYKELTYILP